MKARSLVSVSCILTIFSVGSVLAHSDAQQTAGNSPSVASTTVADNATTGEAAPSYDSDYTAAMRLKGAGENTPEADARPGEYYFQTGARAFAKKDYHFAIQMYQVAASWAYKPAEYNLGVMYARGQGVSADLPRAMAWMALAAERNDPRYVDAREFVYAQLTEEQFDQSNAIWRELKKTYGDEVALRRAKARWADVRAHITGSRVGFVGHLDVGVPYRGSGDPSAAKGAAGVHITSTSSAEVFAGGDEIDGSVAYRQLRESDNPYDPKFERQPLGTATVEPLIPVKTQASDGATSDKPESAKHIR